MYIRGCFVISKSVVAVKQNRISTVSTSVALVGKHNKLIKSKDWLLIDEKQMLFLRHNDLWNFNNGQIVLNCIESIRLIMGLNILTKRD